MGRTQRGNNNAYAQDNEITWLDWEGADGALVDYVSAVHAFRKAHPALTADKFFTGQEKGGVRDVIWLHPDGREMNEGDWQDRGASVLGMELNSGDDHILVWFNRRAEPVTARLPPGGWTIGLVSDDRAEVTFSDGTVVLPPRSVLALVPGETPRPQPKPVETPPPEPSP
jgi:glycogen operon protein